MTKRLWAPEGKQVSSMMNRNRSGMGATTRSTGDTPSLAVGALQYGYNNLPTRLCKTWEKTFPRLSMCKSCLETALSALVCVINNTQAQPRNKGLIENQALD